MQFFIAPCIQFWVCVFAIIGAELGLTKSVKVPMRIVKDTASYGYYGNNIAETDVRDRLVAKVKPSDISGPVQLYTLFGKCYNLTLDRYRYIFCPFQNMTQYEISNRWNAYQGIIGVWDQWNIENNTFTSMMLSTGDQCGDTDRSAEVFFNCGPTNELLNVTEPKKCHYRAVFNTKLVCHPDALLVYPRLSPDLQKKWNFIYTEFHAGDLTEKGYKARLKELFQEANLIRRHQNIKEKHAITDNATISSDHPFNDIATCNKEYSDLKKEVAELQQEMESLKLLFAFTKAPEVKLTTIN